MGWFWALELQFKTCSKFLGKGSILDHYIKQPDAKRCIRCSLPNSGERAGCLPRRMRKPMLALRACVRGPATLRGVATHLGFWVPPWLCHPVPFACSAVWCRRPGNTVPLWSSCTAQVQCTLVVSVRPACCGWGSTLSSVPQSSLGLRLHPGSGGGLPPPGRVLSISTAVFAFILLPGSVLVPSNHSMVTWAVFSRSQVQAHQSNSVSLQVQGPTTVFSVDHPWSDLYTQAPQDP